MEGITFTPREKQILELLAETCTNEEMCNKLSIGNGTLINHFKNIQRKTRIYGQRRVLLIRYAKEHKDLYATEALNPHP